MAEAYWTRLSTDTLLDHSRVTVVEDEVLLPQGKQVKYLRYENLRDYVTVIAERDGEVAMLREYSYPHDEWLWQFPEGSIEKGETPEQAVTRELEEEAGLATDTVVHIGKNYGHHRRSTEKDFVMVASGIHEVPKAQGDDEEYGTTVHWFGRETVKAMVLDGKIVQKNALAALALYFLYIDGKV